MKSVVYFIFSKFILFKKIFEKIYESLTAKN